MNVQSQEKHRILLVDDEEDVAVGICDYINFKYKEFFKAIPVWGKENLVARTMEAVKQTSPDLTIVDLVLNGTDGVDLSKMVLKVLPNTKILYLTGCPSTDSLRKKANKTKHPSIFKPCNGSEVVQKIKDILACKQL